ncbi:hypothetical protein SMICM17S_12262 [Streptomyces microflavus]
MKKESDGIALGDERMKAEGRQEQDAARRQGAARALRRPPTAEAVGRPYRRVQRVWYGRLSLW